MPCWKRWQPPHIGNRGVDFSHGCGKDDCKGSESDGDDLTVAVNVYTKTRAAPRTIIWPLSGVTDVSRKRTHPPQHQWCNGYSCQATTALKCFQNILWQRCIIWLPAVPPLLLSHPVRNKLVLGGLMLKKKQPTGKPGLNVSLHNTSVHVGDRINDESVLRYTYRDKDRIKKCRLLHGFRGRLHRYPTVNLILSSWRSEQLWLTTFSLFCIIENSLVLVL